MSAVRSVLVVDHHLPYVRARLGGAGTWGTASGGLVEGEVPAQAYDELLRDVPSQSGAWRPGLTANHDMRAAFVSDPRAALVRGNPMDYHGTTRPVQSVRRLAARGRDRSAGEGVLVGVVDTGMRSHPWLDGGYLASPADFEPFDEQALELVGGAQAGHGTFVTGLILQQAQSAGVWVERALDTSGSGKALAVAQAARTLAKRHVDVLNLSLGSFDDEPGALPVMERMLEELHAENPGMVVVASAGNLRGPDGDRERGAFWPAALPGVVAVGAVEEDEHGVYRPAGWSNWGPWVDLCAPGTDLLSTYLYDRAAWDPAGARVTARDDDEAFRGWARWSGTSFSAAIVSGTIARLMTEEGQTARGAVERLREGVDLPRVEGELLAVPVVEPADWSEVLHEGPPPGGA